MRAREQEASVESLGGPEIIAKQGVEEPEDDGIQTEPTIATAPSVSSRDDSEVPKELRIAAAYSWRLIVLAAALVCVVYMLGRLSHVVIPLAISLLLSALLSPPARFLRYRAKFPPSLASGLVLVAGLLAVIGTLTLVVTQIVDKFDELAKNAAEGAEQVRDWLQDGPLKLDTEQIDNGINTATGWLTDNQDRFVS